MNGNTVTRAFKIPNRLDSTLLLISLGIIIGLMVGPRLFPDSQGYISFNQSRTILYPMIISFFRLFFGSYGLNILACVQLVAVLLATQLLSKTIVRVFDLSERYILWMFILGMMPWIMDKDLRFATAILTDPFTYLFYVLFITGLFRLSKKYSHKRFIFTISLMMLMQLMRPQMLFVLSGYMVWALYWCFYKKEGKTALLVMLVSIFCAGITMQINDFAHQYVFNKG